VGWAAGIFDGEGSMAMSRYQPRLWLTNADPEILERFKEIVGNGAIYRQHFNNKGTEIRQWSSTGGGEGAKAVMNLLYPLLSRRRRERWDELLAKREAYLESLTIPCVNCGQMFRRRDRQRYCTPACRNRAYRARMLAR